jgi:predicted ATPase
MQDPSSLGVLFRLVTDCESGILIVLCAVDDGTETHPIHLNSRLSEIEDAGTSIHHIAVTNLDLAPARRLLASALKVPTEMVELLAQGLCCKRRETLLTTSSYCDGQARWN